MTRYAISLLVYGFIIVLLTNQMTDFEVVSFSDAVLFAFLLGLFNATIGAILRLILNVVTMGIVALLGFGFVIRIISTGICIKILDNFMDTVSLAGYMAAFKVAFALAIVGFLLDLIFKNKND
jgi:putative membrane protein